MSTTAARPKLVVVYHRQSLSPLEIIEAARERVELIWVMDCGDPELAWMLMLIRRHGTVVDTAGLGDEEVAARVARESAQGVITFAEQLPLAAAIAQASGMRFHTPKTADLLTNKYRQRLALAENGVPGPAFWPVPGNASLEERARLAATVRYPMVLKPQIGLGTRSTFEVGDVDTLLRILADPHASTEDMLAEEKLREAHWYEERRVSAWLGVDSFISDGVVTHLAVTGHFILAPPFRATGSFLPSHLDEAETTSVLRVTEAAITALGVDDAFTNTDVVFTPEGPRVLEVNGRIGGNVPALLRLAGGPTLIPEAMKFAVGIDDVDVAPPDSTQVAFCVMYQPPMEARRVLELGGLDRIGRLPGVTRVALHHQAGDPVDWREGTASRLFSVYGVTPDHDALFDLYQQITTGVTVRYETADPLAHRNE